MKKAKKLAILVGGLATGITAYNRYIFNKVNNEKHEQSEGNYRSTYGNIAYKKSGNGGTPILLVHGIGIGCSMNEWDRNIAALSREHTVYAIDLLGFGNSARCDITYTAYLYVQILDSFINDVIKGPTHIIASNTAAGFACSLNSFNAENILSITLVNPTGIGTSLDTATNDNKKLRMFIDSKLLGTSAYNMLASRANIRHFLEDEIFFNKNLVDDKLVESYYINAHKFGKANKYAISSFLSKYLNVDLGLFLPDIEVPIYVVWGENDDLNPVSNLKALHKIKSDIKSFVFGKCKSLPHYENYREFNNLILKNLNNK